MTKPVFTNGHDSTDKVFIPFHRVRVEDWVRARVSVIREASSSPTLIHTSTAVRYANIEADLLTAIPVAMPTTPLSQTADGQEFGQDFKSLDDAYQLVEFGIETWNASGASTTRLGAQVTMTIDLQQ